MEILKETGQLNEQVITEYGVKGRSGRKSKGAAGNKPVKLKRMKRGKMKGTYRLKSKSGKVLYLKMPGGR